MSQKHYSTPDLDALAVTPILPLKILGKLPDKDTFPKVFKHALEIPDPDDLSHPDPKHPANRYRKKDKEAIEHKHIVVMGFDSEYVQPAESDYAGKRRRPPKKGKPMEDFPEGKNEVLSYQTYSFLPHAGQPWHWAADVEGRKRLSLQEVVAESLMEGKRKGCFRNWPTAVVLVAHYSVAEFTSVSNYSEIKRQFDGIRKTFVSLMEPLAFSFYDDNRLKHEVVILLRDTRILAPAGGGSLDQVSKSLGLQKLEMTKEEMKDLRPTKKSAPARFWQYGMRDAEITALYFMRIFQAAEELLGFPSDPLSLGSLAIRLAQTVWKAEGIPFRDMVGKKLFQRFRFCSQAEEIDHPKKLEFQNTAKAGYMGARNESFWFGASPVDNWFDYDLKQAYVTAMATMGIPLWDELRLVKSISDLTLDVIGVAMVDFEFPTSVRFPTIPMKGKTGLMFPRKGRCWCTSPEIWLAQKLGAAVQLVAEGSTDTALRGFVLPMDHGVKPFAKIAKVVHERRKEYKGKDDLLEELIKELGNSIYGKLAQAVKVKSVFDTRADEMKDLPPSRITNDYLALHTTGLVRAVMGEILNSTPRECSVLSATTDGFIVNLPEERMSELCQGGLAELFSETRLAICENPVILEVKHRVPQVVIFRTRGAMTLNKDGKAPTEADVGDICIVAVKGGIKTATRRSLDTNEELLNMFVNRIPGRRYPVKNLRGFRELYQFDGAADLNEITDFIAYTMDYDWKRKPTFHGEAPVVGVPHLWFDTEPMETLDEYEHYREQWRQFRKLDRILKTEGDLQDFLQYLSVAHIQVRRKGRGDHLQIAKKAFLRAYTQEAWGITRDKLNHELAAELTEAGYFTSVHEIENAQRKSSKLLEHCVPGTPEVRAFLAAVLFITPDFPCERLFAGGISPSAY